MSNIGCVIFDMDGVIIDSEPLHFAVDLMILEQFGLNLEKEKLEQYVDEHLVFCEEPDRSYWKFDHSEDSTVAHIRWDVE